MKQLRQSLSGFIFVFLCVSHLLYPTKSFADGSFFYYKVEELGNPAESPNQRAFILHDGELETLILQVKYSGSVEDFAWVVPLPSLPEENSITTVNDSVFEELHNQTQPRLYRSQGRIALMGGTWHYRHASSDVEVEMEVEVWDKFEVGPYEVAVISGSSSLALIDWLNSNDFHFPDQAHTAIDFYIKKQWYFMATRVHVESIPQESASTYQMGLPALEVTFPTEKPVYPLRISELTSAKENEIELYVAAPHRMVCESYHTAAVDPEEVKDILEQQVESYRRASSTISCTCKDLLSPETKPEYDYETIFRDKLESFVNPTFMVETAQMFYTYEQSVYDTEWHFYRYLNNFFPPDTTVWLTRFRTVLNPNSMHDDVTFVPDPQGDDWLFLQIEIQESAPNPWSALVFTFPAIFLLPLYSFRRIREHYRRGLMLSMLLITIATL